LKQHKPRLDGDCLGFLNQRKQAITQALQDPNQSKVDNLYIVRRKACKHFRNKKKEYMRDKIDEHKTNSKNKNIRDFIGVSMTLLKDTGLEMI
jgi:hypothetical protein